jgi:hypothetical protein
MSVLTSVGTDATIAQHIETITEREYVVTKQEGNTKYLAPSTLGIGLIEGYDKLGFNKSFSKPFLRREARKESILLVFFTHAHCRRSAACNKFPRAKSQSTS